MLTRRESLVAIVGQAVSPAAANRPVRIGVVGGNFGATFQWHLHPNARVTAVCDLRDDRLAQV